MTRPEIKQRGYTFNHNGVWECRILETDKRRVELYVSPTGRSQRVFVDGHEVTP